MLTEQETLELARESIGYDRNYMLTPVHFETVCVVHMSYIRKVSSPGPPRPANVVDLPARRKPDLDPEFEAPIAALPGDEPIGHAPFLIDKRTGEIIHTGTAVLFSDEHYVAAYLDCGDPCAEETNRFRVTGFRQGAEKNKVIRALHVACDIGLQEAAGVVERVLQGETVELEAHDTVAARGIARQLEEMGFIAGQCYRGAPASLTGYLLDESLLDDELVDIDLDEVWERQQREGEVRSPDGGNELEDA